MTWSYEEITVECDMNMDVVFQLLIECFVLTIRTMELFVVEDLIKISLS